MARGGSDTETAVAAVTNEPDDVVAVGDDELPLLFDATKLAVGEVVAYQLPSLHAEWYKTVSAPHETNLKGFRQKVSVKIGNVRAGLADAGHHFSQKHGRDKFLLPFAEQESVAVAQDKEVLRRPFRPGLTAPAAHHFVLLGSIESLAEKPLVQQSALRERVKGEGVCRNAMLPESLLNAHIIIRYAPADVFAGATQMLHSPRVDAPKQGDDIEAQAVALKGALRVGGIRDVWLSSLFEESKNLAVAQTKQWTDDALAAWAHASQTAQSGAPKKVEQERLGLVVLMMAYGYEG